MKKCPPGVFCIENYAMVLMVIGFGIVLYTLFHQHMSPPHVVDITVNNSEERPSNGWWGMIPSWPYSNLPSDPLLNPYAPPLRDERYFFGVGGGGRIGGMVPINVATNIGSVDTPYRQVGILTASNSNGKVIPLMGRPLFVNRDKWQYYTNSDQNNSMRLPVSRSGKSCTNEYGCDKLFTGDSVYVEGINESYRVTLYDNDTIKYLPFL